MQMPKPFPELPTDIVDALTVAVDLHVSGASSNGELVSALRAFTARARETQLRPEQLLVGLHQLWDGLPRIRALQDAKEREAMRRRIVQLTIEAFYEDA